MSKIPYIIIVILAIALAFFVMKSCKPNTAKDTNTINAIKHTSDSLSAKIDSVLESGDILKAQMKDTASYWQAKYNAVINEQSKIRTALNKEQSKTQVLLNELSLVTSDTTKITDCDQLQHEVNSLLALTQQLEYNTDTTNSACGLLIGAKDSIIAVQSNQIDTLKTGYAMQKLQVNKALLQASVELKQIKRQGTWEKIFAIVAGGGIIYSLIKK